MSIWITSKFCSVQVLLGLGNLSALWNNRGFHISGGFDCTQTYVNAFGIKQTVRNIVIAKARVGSDKAS